MEHPFFLAPYQLSKLLLSRNAPRDRRSPRSETASDRADVPGGRERRMLRHDPAIQTVKGGIPHGEEGKGRKEEGC